MYLVCDGGGTKTDFLLFEGDGTVCAKARGGSTNANFISPETAANVVRQGIESCLSQANADSMQVKTIMLFIPGFGRALDTVKTALGRNDILLAGDEKSAFYAALGGPFGISVLSGTGSFASGRDRNGCTAKAGGWGPLYSDEGSGYDIGVHCLSKLAWLCDNEIRGTLLEQVALEHLGIAQVPMIRTAVYRPEFDRKRIASLSFAVAKAAELGDPHACAILDDAAQALAGLAAIVAGRIDADGLPIALTGGVSNMGPLFTDRFREAAERLVPQCTCRMAQYRPIVGAALCVLNEIAGANITDPRIGERLQKGTGECIC